jgi:hypothetical protein
MTGKLILTISMTVTSEGASSAKFYVDPDEVAADDTIRVECPRSIDPKALDISKVIQGALPGIIEEHNRNWNREYDRVKELAKPSLFTVLPRQDEPKTE